MRKAHLLFSCIHLLTSLLSIVLGVFVLSLRYTDQLQLLLMRHSALLLKFGTTLIVLGVALITALFIINRNRYYQVKMTTHSIDEKLLRTFLTDYWKKQFPEQTSPDVLIHAKKRLEILAELPQAKDDEEKEILLQSLEKELGRHLTKTFGYNGEFLLTVSS